MGRGVSLHGATGADIKPPVPFHTRVHAGAMRVLTCQWLLLRGHELASTYARVHLGTRSVHACTHVCTLDARAEACGVPGRGEDAAARVIYPGSFAGAGRAGCSKGRHQSPGRAAGFMAPLWRRINARPQPPANVCATNCGGWNIFPPLPGSPWRGDGGGGGHWGLWLLPMLLPLGTPESRRRCPAPALILMSSNSGLISRAAGGSPSAN